MTTYIDADSSQGTWRLISEAGNFPLYNGRANRGDVILRWGANHSRYRGRYPAGVRVLNPILVMSKLEQAHLFRQANVSMPTVYGSRAEWERDGSPQVVIKPEVGQMGTGMRLLTRPGFDQHHLFQRYIPKEREFRAMMVDNLIAFFMEKHPPANGDFRWNEHRGSEWSSVPNDRSLRQQVRVLGKAALDALGYNFGAVDIIMHGRDLFVLEVNSRPEFGETNAQRFVNAINDYLERPVQSARTTRPAPAQAENRCPHCGQIMPTTRR